VADAAVAASPAFCRSVSVGGSGGAELAEEEEAPAFCKSVPEGGSEALLPFSSAGAAVESAAAGAEAMKKHKVQQMSKGI
jgi:hypothetical protein